MKGVVAHLWAWSVVVVTILATPSNLKAQESAWLPEKVSSSYDPKVAATFLTFSKAAYCSKMSIDNWDCVPCSHVPGWNATVIDDKKTGGQALVASSKDENAVFVSFRGSTDIPNWIQNLNFSKVSAYPNCPNCRVHGGFYDSFEALRPAVVQEVLNRQAVLPRAKLFVTGHSLGAAIAVLAAADFHYKQGFKIEAVHTFGQPRVGNQYFRDFYNTAASRVTWRVTHWRDPVPHLPFRDMDFVHIPTEVFYNSKSDSFKVCNGSGEDSSCSNQFLVDSEITDHLHYLGISTGCD